MEVVRIDQKWSISVKTGDFGEIDGFEMVGDVNWIIDKSWQVHVKVVNSGEKCEI